MLKKTAMVAVIGRANVGKSSLTNLLTGDKVAIVTPKPQTTRNRIFGVFSYVDTQMILLDTPGFHKAKNRLGEHMVNVVKDSIIDVDVIVLMIEPIDNIGKQEDMLIDLIEKSGLPGILIINKIDTVNLAHVLPIIESYSDRFEFDAIIPISAKNNAGITGLLDELIKYGKEGPLLFPEGMTTDQPEKQIIAEIIREKLLVCLDMEIPHGIAIEITKFSQRENDNINTVGSSNNAIIDIEATIFCERKSHKGMIIGKSGVMLKKIGKYAREDIEAFMGAKVFLQTWVKVKENWRDNSSQIRNFGYDR